MNKVLAFLTGAIMLTITIMYAHREISDGPDRNSNPPCTIISQQLVCEGDENYSDYRVCDVDMGEDRMFLVTPYEQQRYARYINKKGLLKNEFLTQSVNEDSVRICIKVLNFNFNSYAK